MNDEIRKLIIIAIAEARKKPLSLEQVMTLAQGTERIGKAVSEPVTLASRPPGYTRPSSVGITIPLGYDVAVSFEQQPPPVGLCMHLSISVKRKGKVPHDQAVRVIAREFGMFIRDRVVWLEEFQPGHYAVNIVEPIEGGKFDKATTNRFFQ